MAVTYDNAAFTAVAAAGGSITLTCAANSILFAFVQIAGGSVSAMTIDGNAMLSVAGAQTQWLQAWVYSAPGAGVHTIKCHMPAALQFGFAVASYTGHQQNNAFGTVKPTSSGTALNYNISVSSTTTDLVIHAINVASATADTITINNGTTRLTPQSDSSRAMFVLADIPGAPSITLSATCIASHPWESVSIPLHATVAAAASTVPFRMLLGVGI